MKSLAVLGFAGLGIPRKIERGRFIVTSMTANANFTTPSPPLATITTNINGLETAYIAAQGGGADDTANMRAKEAILDLSFKLLASYVEGIANASPLNAEAIILSAGMNVKAKGSRTANDFDVKYTGKPGEVKLMRRSIKRGTYEFQMSTDATQPAGWTNIYSGTRGRIVKNGLTSGTRYYFRVAIIDKNGMGPWSDVKSVLAM